MATMYSDQVEHQTVRLGAGAVSLEGDLALPPNPKGVVLFAHGSGSSRFSPRNRAVAAQLQDEGLATLLIDLLTPAEERVDERTTHLRFDIGLLAERLAAGAEWLGVNESTRVLPLGLFGASTGGGAALVAAARMPQRVRAVVSRGGRPDLAGAALREVCVPTLLIVGGYDEPVIEMNEAAARQMNCTVRITVVPKATHLFEEPGAMEQVATLAADWFLLHLRRPA